MIISQSNHVKIITLVHHKDLTLQLQHFHNLHDIQNTQNKLFFAIESNIPLFEKKDFKHFE